MDYLKEKLFSGDLKPGDEINLTELGTILGISRTPIREALIQLMKDGFIEGFSRKGFKIKRLVRQEIEDLYAVGGILESEILKAACEKMTASDFEAAETDFSFGRSRFVEMYRTFTSSGMLSSTFFCAAPREPGPGGIPRSRR